LAIPLLQRLAAEHAAFVAERERAVRRLLSLPNVFHSALTTRVGNSAHDVVFQSGSMKLLRYRRERPATQRQPVLFCYALVNRPYILDLLPDKSVVQQYLRAGFDVYLIDWGVPSAADHTLTLERYVCGFLQGVVEFILRAHGQQKLHLLGYCMGGTMSALFAALNPSSVESLTLLAAPLDFAGREGLLSLWTDPEYFDVDAFIDANGNCPAAFLQSVFLCLKPVQNLLAKNVGFFEQMDDPRFLQSYFAMERWANDNIPVAGETFREFVKNLYQRNELTRGELALGERRVDLGQITCPVLLLTATQDHLVPPASTLRIKPKLGSRNVTTMAIDAGHVGLVVSAKAQKKLWPDATRWLAERESGDWNQRHG